MIITLRDDLDAISAILNETFKIPAFKRSYDEAFGKIAQILYRYGIVENARNLRFRFILCMQESEDFAIAKFREWIIEQVI
jgi:hypothetical protein